VFGVFTCGHAADANCAGECTATVNVRP
jgi:hypothetical protein